MNNNLKDIQKYILLGYTPKKNSSIEKNILYSGHWGCFWAIVIWILAHIIYIFSDYPISMLPFNISLTLLIPLVIFITLKLSKSSLDEFNNKPHKRASPYVTTLSTIGAIGGFLLARFFLLNSSQTTNLIIFLIILVFTILFCIFIACISYYKVYLIRKFCPHFKNRNS